ncbi:H-type lectin domain-containing protein [Pseudoxanthomonas sp.]|uniref:H-type lectin domain-containing protein n=1 Tax=Pseudoxanthomonas sp. TaxID=1871049 RepID=UPI00261DBAFC|nr:H-type lectin domain-containing protein [Pseudoxanthomonas sp.]WDS36246.1 MAG: H-type lectin domain-containing protein [Pseudoxanthomonas sp.]
MSGTRFYDPAPVMFGADGTEIANGGLLYFYELGTTTEKATYSDSDLTTANTNPVVLDSAGRAEVNIWLDGTYTVKFTDADGNAVWTRTVGADESDSDDIPTLVSGQFLTNDGTSLKWSDITQVPDPTDLTDYVLKSDGTQAYWAESDSTDADVDYSSTTIRVGGMLILMGSSSIGTGANVPTKNIDFPLTFDSAPKVYVTMTQNGVNSTGYSAIPSVSAVTATYFTITADSNRGVSIANALTFDYLAIGPYTAE